MAGHERGRQLRRPERSSASCKQSANKEFQRRMLRITSPIARWSLNFVHDQFACGRRFRILNVVDDVTRECLAAIPDTSISGRRVARELTTLIEQRGKPGMIVSDNGTEFTSNAMLAWAEEHNITWHFIAPGNRSNPPRSVFTPEQGCSPAAIEARFTPRGPRLGWQAR